MIELYLFISSYASRKRTRTREVKEKEKRGGTCEVKCETAAQVQTEECPCQDLSPLCQFHHYACYDFHIQKECPHICGICHYQKYPAPPVEECVTHSYPVAIEGEESHTKY